MINLIFRVLFLIPFGFFFSGFLISNIVEISDFFVSSFIISSVLIFEIVFYFQILHIPIDFYSVLISLILINSSLCIFLILAKKKFYFPFKFPSFKKIFFNYLPYFIFFSIIFIRLWNAPLLGPDVNFRWNFLAERILKMKNFSYYPPFAPEHFKFYFYPDSIPPMVSFSYFYIYCITGTTLKSLTSILILIQILSIFIITQRFTEKLFDRETSIINQLLLISVPFIFFFVFIGQESGYITLSIISTIYFIYISQKEEKISYAICAGFATSLGILSREYGWAFIICGIITFLILKSNLKKIISYLIVVFILSFPWYLRTWILTGNPFYSLPIKFFDFNPVIGGILKTYEKIFALNYKKLKYFFLFIFEYSLIPIITGLLGSILFFKNKGMIILINTFIISILWIYSIKYTVSQILSVRVLMPGIILLSITGAGFISWVKKKNREIYKFCILILIFFCLRSIPFIIFYPTHPSKIPYKNWFKYLFCQKILNEGDEIFLPQILNNIKVPVSRILSDNAYAHSVLVDSKFEIVPVWSPEVYFIFENSLSGNEIRKKLKKLNINAVLYYPKNLNNLFLNQFYFFSEDRKNWQIIFKNDFLIIYLLP